MNIQSMSRAALKSGAASGAPFAPAIVLFVLWLVWVGASGGYFPVVWYPSLVVAALLLVVTIVVGKQTLPVQGPARCALFAFAALVALSYLSILWSASRDGALEASNKLLLYLVAAWVLSILPWTPRSLAVMVGVFSLAAAAFCAIELVRATSASNLDPFFVQDRYSTPLAYPNATGALGVMGMWPALILSARPEVHRLLRAACLAVAVFMCEFSLLPQSRAALLGLVITAPLAVLVASNRLRLLVRFLIVGGGLAISAPRTVHVDDVITAGKRVAPALRAAATAMLLTTLAALIVGVLLALAEDRWLKPRAAVRWRPRLARRGWIVVAAVLVIVVSGAAVAAAPRVSHFANTVYHSGKVDAGTGSTRLLSTTPEERFDYIRVAVKLFEGAPVLGVGAGNYGRRYDALRQFPKHSQYVHDVALRTLSETGIVGFALLVVIVGALLVGLVRAARELDGVGRACAVVAFLLASYFLIHDSLDWLDEFPALAVPAFGVSLAAIGLRPARAAVAASPRAQRRSALAARPSLRIARGAALIALGVAFGLAVYGPYLSTRYVAKAVNTYAVHPSAAYSDLARAASLNPWSTDPATTAGEISEQLNNTTRAASAFEQALRLEKDWLPMFELALLDADAQRFPAALHELQGAAKLDADDPLIAQAKSLIVHRQRINAAQFNELLFGGANATLFGSQNLK